ncbi:MAG: DsbA family oxidoreductase [Candidatus Parcubacteria bacterium]|nr:DsbA family oxidoreductase [Burkholderiales bacterium]
MASPLLIEIASDVICPWCYIGKRRLEKALALLEGKVEARIEWLPFQLNPDMPAQGVARAEYRRAKFGSVEKARALDARVAQEGAGEGISFAFDRMQRTPNTVAAHQLIDLAQTQDRASPVGSGKAGAVVDALFRAYFEEADDIGDAAVLQGIAERLGVSGWPEGRETAIVMEKEERVRALGISGVPTFIFERESGVSGAYPAENLAQIIREVLAKR